MLPAETVVHQPESQFLDTLMEIADALSSRARVKAGISRVLEMLESCHGVTRSAIVLRKERTRELRIEASRGLTLDEQRRVATALAPILDAADSLLDAALAYRTPA